MLLSEKGPEDTTKSGGPVAGKSFFFLCVCDKAWYKLVLVLLKLNCSFTKLMSLWCMWELIFVVGW